MTNNLYSFAEYGQSNPCFGCPAPCCRMQIIPCKTPESYNDLDYLRYMLQFPNTEAIIRPDGSWSLIKWVDCIAFDLTSHKCRLHGTPQKPLICRNYDAYNCWYKKNFVNASSQEIYRLNLARFDVWIQHIQFDTGGMIASAPDFNAGLELIKDIPIEPVFSAG